MVYASSSSLYNGILPPHREDMAIGVADYYTEARLAMERMAELYQRLYGIASVGLRFFSFTVPGRRQRAVCEHGHSVPLGYESGQKAACIRRWHSDQDFTYVLDVVRAMRLAMIRTTMDTECGTGKAWSFNEVIELLNRMMDLSLEAQYTENPIKNYVLQTLADTAKAERTIGFKSRFGLKEGIES